MNPIGCIATMNPIVKSLLEFNEAFEIPKLDAPGLGPDELIELRIKLLTEEVQEYACLLYTSPSPRDQRGSRMPSSA